MSQLACYCICGSTLTGRVEPEAAAADLRAAWKTVHYGIGHGPTDSKGAAAARRREARRLAKERAPGNAVGRG